MKRPKTGCLVPWKFLHLMFVDIVVKLQYLQLIFMSFQCTATGITFCFNSTLEGFRLDATVLELHNVSSWLNCVMKCVNVPCCRSVNYKYSSTSNEPNKCEMLHNLVENTTSVLEQNSSYDHIYLNEPKKAYNSSYLQNKEEKVSESTTKTYISCKDAFEKESSPSDGVYNLQLNENTEVYRAYCRMSSWSTQCDGGGWTLVMKLKGKSMTFEYNSAFWTNTETLNVDMALDGLNDIESKFASYSNTPFTKICVGMKENDVINWIALDYSAASLYSLIADGNYREAHVQRATWTSLLSSSSLQPYCNKEGFNLAFPGRNTYLRLGIVANQEENCESPDSLLGFGTEITSCHYHNVYRWSSGNIASCVGEANEEKILSAFGYIFVQ